MKKKIFIISGVFILISCIAIIFLYPKNSTTKDMVFSETYRLSKEYVSLRAKTDNVLIKAKSYSDFNSWNNEMGNVIKAWDKLAVDSAALENDADDMSEGKFSFNIIESAYAYDKQEISDIFDNAPAGKKIATLAKHLGVDAKRAYKMLQQDQAQVEADGWNEAGDTFRKLEVSAVVIKDGCKVVGYIGGIAATGGAAGLLTGSTLANAAVVVGGADLVLEVTEDGANIALGDNNKISSITNSARKITEPISTLLMINQIPNNLKSGFEKFNSTMVAVDQFRGAAQDGKIIGIEIPAYNKSKQSKVVVSTLNKSDIQTWLDSQREGEKVEVKNNDDTKDVVKINSSSSSTPKTENLYISSPEGKSFSPQSGLSFSVDIKNPQSVMVEEKNTPVWCNWKFYINNELYTTKIVPSVVHANSKSVCGYSTMIIKEKGKLRVEFSLERGYKTKYSEEKNIETLSKTVREYDVM